MTILTQQIEVAQVVEDATPTFNVTKANKTITCTATNCISTYWNFGDGSTGVGTSTSHTYTDYNTYSILIDYIAIGANGNSKATIIKVLIDGSPGTGDDAITDAITDAFSAKPIVIPAECTGNINITAFIEDLPEPTGTSNKSTPSSTLSAYVNFATILIPGSSTVEFEFDHTATVGTSFPTGIITDSNLAPLEFIPAFYTSGTCTINYTFYETENENDNVDLTWDFQMNDISAYTDCTWYNANLAYTAQIMKNLINSDNSETYFSTMGENTNVTQTFGINGWSQLPPFDIKWYTDPATTVAIRRAVLPPPKFKVIVTNNNPEQVLLSQMKFTLTWNFNPKYIFMNMRAEGSRRTKQALIYTLPKGSEATRLPSLGYPIFAVIDGYTYGEVIKVFGTWAEYQESIDDYFPTTIELMPVNVTIEGSTPMDFGTCLYRCAGNPMNKDDFVRVTDGDWIQGTDGITVVDAPTLAESDHYRIIKVTVQDDKSPDDTDAVFEITTIPNDTVDEQVTASDLSNNISKIHFFNVTKDYADSVTVNRTEIDPIFYETLWQTYDDAPILESITNEPLYFINFSINDYPVKVPIYNNQTLRFSDSLQHCVDGKKSGDVFYMDGKTSNVINMEAPTKHKYKVKFRTDYEVYKDVYIMTEAD